MSSWRLTPQSELAILLTVAVTLLGAACTTSTAPEPENQPPVIHSVTAPSEVLASTECRISCEATDADGDDLSYLWSAPDGGLLEGKEESVVWSAPDVVGNYTIRVVVTDGNGGEATDSLTVRVTSEPNQPPAITALVVTLPDQSSITVGQADEQITVGQLNTAEVQCNAEDADGDQLNFVWSTTGGKIHGEGDRVGWIAPGQAGDYILTVTVTDGRGGKAEAGMRFEVPCCGQR